MEEREHTLQCDPYAVMIPKVTLRVAVSKKCVVGTIRRYPNVIEIVHHNST